LLQLGTVRSHTHQQKGSKKGKAPNIIMIMVDDLGTGDLPGWAGENTIIKTPVLDELIAGGVALDRYYTQSSCTPSRTALLTGRYPLRYGLQTSVIVPFKAFGLALNESLAANVFQDAGYATHAVGKWHLGWHDWESTPAYRGFDTFYGISHGEGSHTNFTWSMMGQGPYGDFFRQSKPNCGADCIEILSEGFDKTKVHGYSTMLFTSETVRIIDEADVSKPFFVFLAYTGPHAPCDPPPAGHGGTYDIDDVQRKVYAQMTTTVDEGIGNITAALKARDMFDDTIIIFTNDNGAPVFSPSEGEASIGASICEPLGHWGQDTGATNYPLRGGKGTVYEGGVKGVSLIHYPNGLKGGRRYDGLAHITDWLPTLVSAAGVSDSADRQNFPLDGVDLWQALQDGAPSPRAEIMLSLDQKERGHGGALLRNFTKIYVGGPFKKKSFFQTPPEVAERLGLTLEEVPREVDPIDCPDGCVVDLIADPTEEHPSTDSSELATLKAAYDEYKAAAVPDLWTDYPMDAAAFADLNARGISWPYMENAGKMEFD
jgi:arylsulfatase B/arylsulfatase I/J